MTRALKLKWSLWAAGAVALAAIFALAQFGFSASARAGSRPKPAPPVKRGLCSLATLKGLYVTRQTGWQIAAQPRYPFGTSGVWVFDGAGHAQGMSTRSINGAISRVRIVVAYTLSPDCSGTLTLNTSTGEVGHYDIYVVPSGSRFRYIRTDPGVVGTGSGEASYGG